MGLPTPPGWSVVPFGRLAPRIKHVGRPDLEPLSVFLDDGVVPRSTRDDNFNRLGSDLASYLVVEPGDLVFNKLRTWQGGLGASSYLGIVSPAYFVCRPAVDVDPWFLHYLLRSKPYLGELTRLSKWMPPAQFDIAWDELRMLPVHRPPPATQTAISEFLRDECARIDKVIGLHRALVGLLNERIDAAVRNSVGQSPLAGATGVPAVPLKRIIRKLNRPRTSPEVVTAYRDGEVEARSRRRVDGYTLAANEDGYQGVEVGDIVFHGLDGFAGAVGVARASGGCSPVYHVAEPINGNAEYLARLIRVLALDGYLRVHATSVRERAVDLRNWELFGSIPVPLAPVRVQDDVAAMIARARGLASRASAAADALNEHRQALITAAVYGQLDVTNGAG